MEQMHKQIYYSPEMYKDERLSPLIIIRDNKNHHCNVTNFCRNYGQFHGPIDLINADGTYVTRDCYVCRFHQKLSPLHRTRA